MAESNFNSFRDYANYIFEEYDQKLLQWKEGSRLSGYLSNSGRVSVAQGEYLELKEAVNLFLEVQAKVNPAQAKLLDTSAGSQLYEAMESIINYPDDGLYNRIGWFKSEASNIMERELAVAAEAESLLGKNVVTETAVAVERQIASKVLLALEGVAPVAAGVAVGDLVIMAHTWMESLPDSTLKSPEFVALQQYVHDHGPAHANTHMIQQELQQAEPQQTN